MQLINRVALVTGGAQGIGLAIARSFAGQGARVVLMDLNGKAASAASRTIPGATSRECDVRHPTLVREAISDIERIVGPIEMLVNAAGIWRHTAILELTEEEWDDVFAVNVKGTLFCSQAVGPGMIKRRSGKIVNIASLAGFTGIADWSHYCASKSAVISLSMSLASFFNPYNVHVNVVCPGATKTPMFDEIVRIEQRTYDVVHPPEEVAEAVLKLVTPFNKATTGKVIPLEPVDDIFTIPVR